MADIVNLLAAAAGAGPTAETDENFAQTVLLLHGDGSDGAQNNTFLDSSTNNFTITRNGNTTQGSFSPHTKPDGYWSVSFTTGGATGIRINDDASLRPGTNEFAIEAMIWLKDLTEIATILGKTVGTAGAGDWRIYVRTTGTMRFEYDASGSLQTNTVFELNRWYHIAVTRNSSNLVQIWVDGVEDTSATISSDLNGTDEVRIGENTDATREADAIISNLRFVNGSSYTPTVPTAPLTAITNTVLLTCQSNRFIDNSSYAHTLNVAGTVAVTPYSPFTSSAYDPAVNGGSAYLDGSGDYLNLDNVLAFGTSDWSWETWVYPTSFASINTIVDFRPSGTEGAYFLLNIQTNGKFRVYVSSATRIDADNAINLNEWTHVCVQEVSGVMTMYVNGVAQTTTWTNTTNFLTSGSRPIIGRFGYNTTSPFTGYMSGIRVLIGGYAYDTFPFDPPTAPPTAITNTELLLNFTNAGIYNNALSGGVNLESVGNAQIDTTVKKYGTGSMEFDGSGDWLIAAHNEEQLFGTGPFTIEGWIYPTWVTPGSNEPIVAKGDSSATGTWQFDVQSTSVVRFAWNSSSSIASTGTITPNQWTHIAVVREGTGTNQTKIYINGSNDGTGTVSQNFTNTGLFKIGRNRDNSTAFDGLIDDLRISRVARYTTTFTPPTKAFPDQ